MNNKEYTAHSVHRHAAQRELDVLWCQKLSAKKICSQCQT